MNVYLVERTDITKYDQYYAMVIVALSEDDAINTHPDGFDNCVFSQFEFHDWAHSKDDINVTLLGKAEDSFTEKKVILSGYNAG